ncbi:sulfatase-like hydrolase/transferase [Lacinutrix salivirga]
MASDGVMFTHAYEAAPRCAASRTSIMTGKFESRPSVSGGIYLGNEPAADNPNGYAETTWAQALKDKGYETFFIGKWHLGHDPQHYPDSFGFNTNLGGSDIGAPDTYYHPYANEMPAISAGGSNGDYLTDRITELTNNFISTHATPTQTMPFLAMVSHYGVHTPLETESAADVAYFQSKIDNDITYTGPEFENDLTAKTRLHQNNATYASMIKSIDESLGAIRTQLTASGIADNTIIILTSDNGGLSTTEIGGNRELPTSNRPFRGGKTWLFEGGVRLPLIVYGPDYRNNPAANTPLIVDTPVIGTDFFPTILEMGNAPLMPTQHLDGESFEELLLTTANGGDANYTRSTPLIWDFNFASSGTANVSMAGVRKGDFKLLEFKYNNVFELYNVVTDPGETTDLAASNPAKVLELRNELFSYRSNAGINHRVTNSGQIQENTNLYTNMNTVTGSNIQPSFGCAEPNGTTNKFIYNADHECWYDLDWFLDVSPNYAATIEDSETEARNGDTGIKVTINTIEGNGGFGKVKVNNTAYYDDFDGGDITVTTHAKKSASTTSQFRFRIQVKVLYENGGNSTFNSGNFTTTTAYQPYSFTITDNDITGETKSVEVRLLVGKDLGTVFFDDWTSDATSPTLSTPMLNQSLISVYPNPTSDVITIEGPLVVTKAYIFDVTGKLVITEIGDVEKIDIRELPNGIYFMKAFVEGKQYFTKKIIKQ